jgi:hypothetical protein
MHPLVAMALVYEQERMLQERAARERRARDGRDTKRRRRHSV